MEHPNINAVNVFAVDEEKLKFRVIIAINGFNYRLAYAGGGRVNDGDGAFEIDIPVPTYIANSDNYSQCILKCDSFSAGAGVAFAAPTWATSAGVAIPGSAVELQIGAASSQTGTAVINTAVGGGAGDRDQPFIEVSGYRQLVPGQVVSVGTGLGFAPGNAGYGWLGMMRDLTPLLAANPFGQRMRIRFVDPLTRDKMCIMNSGALANGDIGKYYIQLDVQMVPNK